MRTESGGSKLALGTMHIVLVEPEIHWNTGNIGRTSLAVGAELHLVGPLGFSLDDKELRRAGLDYWPRVRLHRWADWERFERELPRLGEPFFFSASASAEGERAYWDVEYPDACVLVFGRESVGLPAALIDRFAARTLKIPMLDRELRSLNLSTAAALVAYEAMRQQRARKS